MKHVKKSVLLWYSAGEMYRLVTDVATYPEFLPWCERGEVLTQAPAGMTAQIDLSITDEYPLAQAVVIISAVPNP